MTWVAAGKVPFVVGMTGKASGVTFAGAAGDAAPGMKAAPDTVLRIFSMTKSVGSTAAMILIEQGKMDFDTPVQDVLPEFAEICVLEGCNGDKPKMNRKICGGIGLYGKERDGEFSSPSCRLYRHSWPTRTHSE